MDSIRLGYDSKVYHMEQGEPCGDSPPPPPQLPLAMTTSPSPPEESDPQSNGCSEVPAWNNRHTEHMAECQGCIAEQKIEHTCTHACPSQLLPHHSHPDHEHQFVDVQRKTDNDNQRPGEDDSPTPEEQPELESFHEQKPKVARNTWPRKKVRQVRHAADIFDADEDEGDGEGDIMVESGSNYFVSVDDSVCDSGGRLVVEYSLSRTGSVHRIPRNSKNPLPPELETVKKGTPLYGQPSWWGEEADSQEKQAMDSAQKTETKSPRPSSLVVQTDDTLPHPPQHHRDPKAIYMEIPHTTTTPERDKPPLGHRDKTTPARSLSSLSKDSLVASPDSRERSVDKESDPGKPGTTEHPSNPALSFTVEFGDEKKPRLKSGASLSQFVPSKLRHSLSSHARSDKVSSRGRDSDGSCKNSEERELSPVVKQRRSEEQGSEVVSKGKSARRSSGQGTGVASLRTNDFPSESSPSVSSKSRKEADKRPRETEKDGERKPPRSQESRKPVSRSSSTKSSKAKPQPTAAAIAASVQAAQYSDPTAYLIDRMFAGATGTDMDSPRSESSERDRSSSPTAPEHVMYKEAKDYDKASQRGNSTYRTTSSKTSVHRQKSLSKSPASTSRSPANTSKSPAGITKSPASRTKSPAVSTSKSPANTSKSPAGNGKSRAGNGKSPAGNNKSPGSTSKSPAGSTASSKSPVTPSGKTPRTKPQYTKSAKEKSAEPEPQQAPALPVAPPPLETDQEDKVSEAGTYTIEAEEDGEEEMMARQQIDEVFGVDVNSLSFERPVIGSLEQVICPDDEDEGERTLHEDEGMSMEPGCQTPSEEDGENVFDEEEYEEGIMSRSIGEEEVPSWINQLNALTAASRHTPSDDQDEVSKRPAQGGLSRKRPGTGRKLPSIPTASDVSPVSIEPVSNPLHSSPDSPDDTLNDVDDASLENGHEPSPDDSSPKNVTFSPIASAGGGASDRLRSGDSPCGSDDSGGNTVKRGAVAKGSSVCSRGSIDTELLLRDTETVMAAMEARMGFHREDREEEEGDSDTDLTSTVAMVNGDDDYVKPTKYHSPREAMIGKNSKNKDNSNIRLAASSSSSKKKLARSFSEQKTSRGDRSPRSGVGVSVVSDVLSRSDSLDQSFQSDASEGSERTDASFTRSGSRGKGTITMTKPNRAFALRRARADGAEMTDTARSRTTAATSTPSTPSTRRSSSMHGTTRTPCSDRTTAGHSEASLGANIVKKARENAKPAKTRESSITRQDGTFRNSLRGTDRRSSASSSSSSTVSTAKKERDLRTIKSQLKSGPGQKDLAVTGVSSRSQSQPGSRSNSPKAAERMAWKRRKEYDPRKAVAEAKARTKDPRPKPKVQPSSLYKQRMTRSSSFTNSAELSGRVRHDTYNVDSVSSAEDLSSAAMASDSHGEAGFRRAFIPFHNPLRSDRMSHSADEDEAGTFPTSQDPTNGSKPPTHPVTLMLHKSAFTPPLSKLQTPSPDSPSPQAALLLRRRTIGPVDYDEAGASTAPSSHRTQADSNGSLPNSPQSYDSLIVSSIYQLSLKLKTTMDKALVKLRDQDRANITPSPIDDFLGHPAKSEIPAWKSANRELAGVLKNLRKMEHHLHMMEKALFPEEDTDTDVSGMTSTEKHKYFQEIERIRNELAGFQPIDSPHAQSQDPGSPEMAEFSKHH